MLAARGDTSSAGDSRRERARRGGRRLTPISCIGSSRLTCDGPRVSSIATMFFGGAAPDARERAGAMRRAARRGAARREANMMAARPIFEIRAS